MGDPRKIRKKYQTPSARWQKARIDEERPLMSAYGLKNKQELWKMGSILRGFTKQAKALALRAGPQVEKEKEQLLARLQKYGLIKADASLDDVLGITVGDILDRRLQTIVFKKQLARTISQARQMITHCHIAIEGGKVTAPSYLVPTAQEMQIAFVEKSAFADEEHPERSVQTAKQKIAEVTAKAPEKTKNKTKQAPETKEKEEKEQKKEKENKKQPEKTQKAGKKE